MCPVPRFLPGQQRHHVECVDDTWLERKQVREAEHEAELVCAIGQCGTCCRHLDCVGSGVLAHTGYDGHAEHYHAMKSQLHVDIPVLPAHVQQRDLYGNSVVQCPRRRRRPTCLDPSTGDPTAHI
jgi:hypothetical protein